MCRVTTVIFHLIKVAPYSFLPALELISKIVQWRKLSNFTLKSCARSCSKVLTDMTSKFVYRISCLHPLWFQSICLLNRRLDLSLLDLKESCTRYVGVSTKETDLFDSHDHRKTR